MDERKTELKMLKKAFRRVRRRAILAYALLALVCFVACLGCVSLLLPAVLPGNTVALCPLLRLLARYGAALCSRLGLSTSALVPLVGVPAAIFAFLWLGCLLLRILAGRKVRKTDEFLSFRTLKETLRAEKKLRK